MHRRSKLSGVRRARTLRSRLGPRTSGRAGCGSRSWSSTAKTASSRVQQRESGFAGAEAAAVRGDDCSLGEDRRRRRRPADAKEIFVTQLQLAKTGKYWRTGRARRRPEDPGGRDRRGQGADRRARLRRARAVVEDARPSPRDPRSAVDVACAGSGAPPQLDRRGAGRPRAVRRRLRDAEVLLEPHLRPGRGRRQHGAPTPRRRRASASSTWRSTRTTIRPRASTSG